MRTAGVAVSSLARCNVKGRWGPQSMVVSEKGCFSDTSRRAKIFHALDPRPLTPTDVE
jgi:hypothetical protein